MGSKSLQEKFKNISKQKRRDNNKRFLPFVLEKKLLLFVILFSTIITISISSIFPKITQLIIDDYLPQSKESKISNDIVKIIIGILVGLAGIVIVKALSIFLNSYTIRRFQQDIEISLRKKLFAKIQKLEVKNFDNVNEGYFLSRINRDTVMASQYARAIPENIVKIIFSFSINFTFIFMFNWIIGATNIFLLILLFSYISLKRKSFVASWLRVKKNMDNLNQILVNSFAGIKETKAYSQEKNQIKKHDSSIFNYVKEWRKNFLLYGKWMFFNSLILGMLPVSVIAIGSWQVIEGNLSLGGLTALIMYTTQIVMPINLFLAMFDIFMQGTVSLHRIFEILDRKEEKYQGKEIKISSGEIEFKNVHFKYNDDSHALNGVSFKIKPGEKVAFVGKTGTGKSTILKSIIKFYEINKGNILIDGQNIKDISISSLRQNITLMSQEPYIFFDTVRNNVLFSEDNINEDLYQQALKKSDSHEFVKNLPHQDNTNIGPRGATLSGGQKQRISLARAIVKKSKIILFDEATSALDNNTENIIQNQIEKITKQSTVIYIAHRLTTIQNVDRIFVMDKGKIVEQGNHKELMNLKGYYHKMVTVTKRI